MDMLNNISWGQYITCIVILIIIYYTYIIIYYYGVEVMMFLKGKRSNNSNTILRDEDKPDHIIGNDSRIEEENDSSFETTTDDTFNRIEALIQIIKPAIVASFENKLSKDELKIHLKGILRDFQDLRESPFQPAISELIQSECKNNGSMILDEGEVESLWMI